jgi:ferredoxin
MDTVKVEFTKQKKVFTAPKGSDLREVAMTNGINPYMLMNRLFNCKGNGVCKTCKMRIIEGIENCSQPTRNESDVIAEDPTCRLSCQTMVNGDIKVETNPRKK